MNYQTVFLFSIVYLLSYVASEEIKSHANSEKEDVFIATHDWQVIREGQAIPKGLHVRINLQTGLKEAKLLDSSVDQTERSSALSEVYSPHDNGEEKQEKMYTTAELKQVLQNIKSDEKLPKVDDDEVNKIKEKFKSYEQLKSELGDLKLSVKSDAELLRELFKKFKLIQSNKNLDEDNKNMEVFYVLEDFEYLVHQIDNANEFVSLNGFNEIIYPNLNSSCSKVKCEALNILGSSVQNNAKTQIHALETGAIDKLLRILALENNNDVKLRVIYALSSLLRRFPLAQIQFIHNGGLNVFSSLFSKQENMKIQLKIITLIYDLLMEEKDAIADVTNINYKDMVKQYKQIDLKNKLTELGWCASFNNILINNLMIENNDHDAIERCLNVMFLVTENCMPIFNNTKLKTVLEELFNNYTKLSDEEMKENQDDITVSSYFIYLKDLTYNLLHTINSYKSEL